MLPKKSLELRERWGQGAGGVLTDRGGASSGGILVRIKREGLDTAHRDFLGPSICASHSLSLVLLWRWVGFVVGGIFQSVSSVLKSGGSDVEAGQPPRHKYFFFIYTTRPVENVRLTSLDISKKK